MSGTNDVNELRADDDVTVVNAKLRTRRYAGLTDEEIRGELVRAGVDVDGAVVVDGQLVRR